jgi:MFS family permease
MAGDAGMIVGPVTVGFLSDVFSFRTAFMVTAAIFSISILLAYRLPETRQTHMDVKNKRTPNPISESGVL